MDVKRGRLIVSFKDGSMKVVYYGLNNWQMLDRTETWELKLPSTNFYEGINGDVYIG